MAANTNVVVLTGRLTRDPETRQVGPEQTVASFSLAVNGYGDKVSFFDVEAWRRTADIVAQYCSKGKLVSVTGRLEQQRWEKDGQKRSKVVVVASGIELGPKTSEAGAITTDDGFDDVNRGVDTSEVPF